MRRYTWAAVALLLVGGLVCWKATGTDGATIAPAEAASVTRHVADSPGTPTAVGASITIPRGAAETSPLREYTVQVNDDFRPDVKDPSSVGMLLAFEGKLNMGEIERSENLSWTYLKPGSLSFAADSQAGAGLPANVREVLAAELDQAYFAGRDASGQIVEYRFSRPLGSLTQGLLRMIAVATQRVIPDSVSLPTSWTVSEVDAAGEAKVAYQSLGPSSWRKIKTAYTRLISDQGLTREDASGRSIQGEGTVTLDGDHLRGASLEEHSSMQIGHAVMGDDLEVQIVASSGQPDEQLDQLRELLHRLPSVSALSLPQVQVRPIAERLRDVLGNNTFEDLTAALAKLDAEDEDGRRGLLQQFEADLKLNPSHASRLAERLSVAKVPEQSMIVSALSNADTREATVSLREISQDPKLEHSVRETATALLGFAHDPDEETVGHLEHASADAKDPHSGTAMLALGNLADSMRGANPERSEDIVDQLLQRLRASGDEATQRQLLAALGNSGDPRLVQALAPWLASGSAELRGTAYAALRLVGSEQSLAVMAVGCLSDEDPRVRGQAVAALAARPMPGTLQVVVRSLGAEPVPEVRLEAVSVLGMLPLADTELALSHTAESDPDPTVRASALSMLRRDAQQG